MNHINQKLHEDNPEGIKLSDLAYQTEENHAEMEKVSLQAAKAHMPERTIDTELCNQCHLFRRLPRMLLLLRRIRNLAVTVFFVLIV